MVGTTWPERVWRMGPTMPAQSPLRALKYGVQYGNARMVNGRHLLFGNTGRALNGTAPFSRRFYALYTGLHEPIVVKAIKGLTRKIS